MAGSERAVQRQMRTGGTGEEERPTRRSREREKGRRRRAMGRFVAGDWASRLSQRPTGITTLTCTPLPVRPLHSILLPIIILVTELIFQTKQSLVQRKRTRVQVYRLHAPRLFAPFGKSPRHPALSPASGTNRASPACNIHVYSRITCLLSLHPKCGHCRGLDRLCDD